MRAAWLLITLAVTALAGCSQGLDLRAADKCADTAERLNTDSAIRAFVAERAIPTVDEATVLQGLLASRHEAMAYDWTTCLMDAGWRCKPSLDAPPATCGTESVEATNPFLAAAAGERERVDAQERNRLAEEGKAAMAAAQKARQEADARIRRYNAAVSSDGDAALQLLFAQGWGDGCREVTSAPRESGALVSFLDCMALLERTDVATVEDARGFGAYMAEVVVTEVYGP